MKIPFNKPYFIGNELRYIEDAVKSGKISGNGLYTQKCHSFFQKRFGFRKVLLTTSCTDALEMCALLAGVQSGDEVIMPAFTFVSTANAFVLRGARIVFADSESETPNLDVQSLEPLIGPRTKAVAVVHYAGVACDMDPVMTLAKKHGLIVIEDAAQAIDSSYKGRTLGSIGHLAAFSFHETKNVISGEGGMLAVNDERFIARSEIIWEKGTNRAAFFRGEVDKYGWVDAGSSFLPSELSAAFLYAQLEELDKIQAKRNAIWRRYNEALKRLEAKGIRLPVIPGYAVNNAHMFYLVCRSLEERTALIAHLKERGILAVFHYLPLHLSPYYRDKHDGRKLPNAERYSDCLVRLPFYYDLDEPLQDTVTGEILRFFGN